MNHEEIRKRYESNYRYERKFGDRPEWLTPEVSDALAKHQAIKDTAQEFEMTPIGIKRIINKKG